MTAADLIAPKRLRGPMPRTVDRALLADRNGWAIARLAEGHSYRAVAAALGITANAVYLAISKARGRKKMRSPESAAAPIARSDARGKLKFQVTGVTPGGKVISHVIRAGDQDAAGLRWLKSYPDGSVIAEVKLIDGAAE